MDLAPVDITPGVSQAKGLNREPIDARSNFAGAPLSSPRGVSRRVRVRGALRRDRFSEAEHLALVSRTTLPRESIIPGKDRW